MELLLVSGDYERELAAYFGECEYRDLRELARRAAAQPLSEDAIRVFVVPGIMGSQLGIKREPPLPHDILWLDPIDIQVGRLSSLHLSATTPIVPLGVVLYSYLRLKLNLRASGFAPILYDYDWRRGVDELGAALAERIRNEPSDRIMIVAHSMGGLVARAALRLLEADDIRQIVTLGSPHHGTWLAQLLPGLPYRQMQPDSEWLAALNAAQEGRFPVPVTCIYSTNDNLVTPSRSAALQGATRFELRGLGHLSLLSARPAIDCTLRVLV